MYGSTGTAVQYDYRQCEIDWQADGEQVFSGNLMEFLCFMYHRMGIRDERQVYLKYFPGKYLGPGSTKTIADLSVDFRSFKAHHVFSVRMRNVFTETNLASYILFDFDKSDEPHEEKFRIVKETVLRGSVKQLNIFGFTSTAVFTDNLGTIAAINETPIDFLTVSSDYYQGKFTGQELLCMQDYNKGEVVIQDLNGSFFYVNGLFLATRLTDREILQNPVFYLQLLESKMQTTGAWTITYDLIG